MSCIAFLLPCSFPDVFGSSGQNRVLLQQLSLSLKPPCLCASQGRLLARTRPRRVFNHFRGSRAPPPFVDPIPRGRRVGRSATGVPRGGGRSVGTPTYIPQNDPHDALIILNMHKWVQEILQKKNAHKLRLPSAKVRPGGWVGVKMFFCVFHPFLNSQQNSEYFEILSIDT